MLKYFVIIILLIAGILYREYYKLNSYISKLSVNENFDGNNFRNTSNDGAVKKAASLKMFLEWRFGQERGEEWPKKVSFPERKILLREDEDEIVVTFINHSTLLIQTPYGNIITDPVFAEKVGPFNLIGPKRVHAPGIKINDLPKIDYVLVSHDHYDHLDLDSLKRIYKKDKPQIYGGLGLSVYDQNLHIKEMDWWHIETINPDLKIHFVPAKHWSGRYGFFGNNKTLWGGFLIEIKGKMIYFAGDTAFTKHFLEIASRYPGKIILSFLPIGAYEPRWFMESSHTNPEEAVKAHLLLGSKKSIAIHHGTFRLSNEGYKQPITDLKKAIDKYALPENEFVILKPGESLSTVLD